ncbi:MAG: hypothetical protein ACX932_06370 [Gammaproteobacteria bacterium]
MVFQVLKEAIHQGHLKIERMKETFLLTLAGWQAPLYFHCVIQFMVSEVTASWLDNLLELVTSQTMAESDLKHVVFTVQVQNSEFVTSRVQQLNELLSNRNKANTGKFSLLKSKNNTVGFQHEVILMNDTQNGCFKQCTFTFNVVKSPLNEKQLASWTRGGLKC